MTLTVMWNGGSKVWTSVKKVHYTDNVETTLCGLKISGYYETEVDDNVPRCMNCLRVFEAYVRNSRYRADRR